MTPAPPPTPAAVNQGEADALDLALVAALRAGVSFADLVWFQRVVNRRLLHEARGAELDHLLRVADAVGIGGMRVARLLRELKKSRGPAGGKLPREIEEGLAILSAELGEAF
jgi:hypothetical protein